MENYDMIKEDRNRRVKSISVPSYIPRLFVAPSCLPKFAVTVELIAEMKARLSSKTLQLKELSMNKNDDQESMEKLHEECSWLCSEIDLVESEASVMRKELVQRIYLEVRSVKEMMAVNDLMSVVGVGATPDMQCFEGNICVGGNLSKNDLEGIMNTQRSRKIFRVLEF